MDPNWKCVKPIMQDQDHLLYACAKGDLKTMKGILADTERWRLENECRDNHHWTALHHAVDNGSIECVRLLLDNPTHVPIFAQTFEGQTALHLACERSGTSAELVRMLLEAYPDLVPMQNNEDVCALYLAIERGRDDLTKLIIEVGQADVNNEDLDGEYALFYAIRAQNYKLVVYLLSSTNSHVTKLNANNIDPLTLDLNLFRRQPRSPLHLSCLKLLATKYYQKSHSINGIITQIFTCINHRDSEMCTFFLDCFYLDARFNAEYAAVLQSICAADTLTECFKLYMVLSLHDSVNPMHRSSDATFCQHYSNGLSKIGANVLFALFALTVDDLTTYRQIAEPWWKVYAKVANAVMSNWAAIEVISGHHILWQFVSYMFRGNPEYTTVHFLQFTRELSVVPASRAVKMELLFQQYVSRVSNHFNSTDRKIMDFLLVFDTATYPHGHLCQDELVRQYCNQTFRDTGDVIKDIKTYQRLIKSWPDQSTRSPNTLFNITRAFIRERVFKTTADRRVSSKTVVDLWALPLPLVVKAKLTYNHILLDLDQVGHI